MKVSLNIYGEQARQLAAQLNGATTLPMTGTFKVRYVEGRAVVAASFESYRISVRNELMVTKL